MSERDACIFCRIVDGEIAATIVREDDDTIAFRDLDPKAPLHVLVIPRRHIASVDAAADSDGRMLGALFIAAREVARQEGVALSGYRLVVNTGDDAGQTVKHIHMHVLAGRSMKWPPG